jgi:hypothetical protein
MGTPGSPPTRLTAVPDKWVRPTRRPANLSVGPMLGEYPKNSDNYPNTRGVLNTFKYTVRAQRV